MEKSRGEITKAGVQMIRAAILGLVMAGPAAAGGIGDVALDPLVVLGGHETIADQILHRADSYQLVKDQAQSRGIALGFLQGAMIGGAASGSAGGVIFGGVLGGLVGKFAAEKSASSLIQEHQNYLIHKASLEEVMISAQRDRENTSMDLLLAKRYFRAATKDQTASDQRVKSGLIALHRAGAERLLAMQEIESRYKDQAPSFLRNLRAEIQSQAALMVEFSHVMSSIQR